MNGPIKVWNDSSFLIMDGAYDKNLKNDKWIYYDLRGKRDSTLTYVKGKRYGEYKAWHDNGNVSVNGSFFDDKKNKKWNWFSDNKTLDSSKTFNLGELDGPAFFSFKNGNTKAITPQSINLSPILVEVLPFSGSKFLKKESFNNSMAFTPILLTNEK